MPTPTVEKAREDLKKNLNGASANAETAMQDLSHRVTELTNRMRDMSANLADESATMVKRYPFHTALGAAVIGFVAGAFLLRGKK